MKRILVISDLHLTHTFEKKKFEYLKRKLSEYDHVIINGDFWDNWFTTFDKFVNSKWKELFPLLKEKNCVYVSGNHDPIFEIDERHSLFSNTLTEQHEVNFHDNEYVFVHGNEYLKEAYQGFIGLYSKVIQFLEKTFFKSIIYNIMHILERIGYFLSKKEMINSKIGRTLNERFIERYGRDTDRWVIFAHTHTSMVDRRRRFANAGCIINRTASYLEINDEGIKVIQENY